MNDCCRKAVADELRMVAATLEKGVAAKERLYGEIGLDLPMEAGVVREIASGLRGKAWAYEAEGGATEKGA